MPAVPQNVSVEWLLGVALVLILVGAAWLIRWLFRQVIAAANQRAEDFKEQRDLERARGAILEERLQQTGVVAEAAARILNALPSPQKEAQS